MQKELITAENIRLARLSGQNEIFFKPGAIITQQAQEDAKHYGIHLVLQPEKAPKLSPAQNPSVTVATPQREQGNVDRKALQTLLGSLFTTPILSQVQIQQEQVQAQQEQVQTQNVHMQNAQTQFACANEKALIAQVRAQVRALLPEGIIVDDSCIAEAIHRVLGSVCTAQEIRHGVRRAHGVTHVDASVQKKANPLLRDSLSIMEVLSPTLGDLTAVGYLEWENMTVPWTSQRPEVLVILEGSLSVSIERTTFHANAGDIFSFPANSGVQFHSKNHVKCVTVACLPVSEEGNQA